MPKARRPAPPPRRAELPVAVAGLSLVALALIAHWPGLWGGFVWDDDVYLTANPLLREPGGLWRLWTDPLASIQYYPLTFTTFWLELRLWGLAPFGFHLDNLLLHALDVVLLWWLLRRLAVPGAWIAAALFAVHPLHVESVAWVTERKNVLSLGFALGAALSFLRWREERSRSWYAAALSLYAAALLSKTAVLPLPAVLVLALWWKDGALERRDALALLPFFALGLASAGTTAWLERHHVGAQGADFRHTALERVLIAGRALWFYAGKIAWPQPLMFNYPRWRIDVAELTAWLWPAAFTAVLAALFAWRRRLGRGALVAVLIFAGTLLPVLGLVDFFAMRYAFVADHFAYVPSIVLLTLAAAGLITLAARFGDAGRRGLVGVVAALLLALAFLSQRQSRAYRDVESLWRDTLAKNPASWMAHNNLGAHLSETGRLDEAELHWREGLRLAGGRAEIHGNLGRAAMAKGRLDEAESEYRAALALAPELARERLDLGVVLTAQRRFDEAVAQYQESLRQRPDDATVHAHLGVALASLGRLDEARQACERALELDPGDAQAHNNLGLVLAAQDQFEAAAEHYVVAIRLAPDMAEAHNNYAIALERLGRNDDALVQYEAVVRLAPRTAEAQYNLAAALEQRGRGAEAAAHYREALRLRPDLGAAASALQRVAP